MDEPPELGSDPRLHHEMNVPDFFQSNTDANIRYAVGERYGNVYGKTFVTQLRQLPADFAARCGTGKDWQANDQGYIVWVGAGNTYKDGVTKNLWQAQLLGCTVNGVATASITGATNCLKAGGTVNTPWGQPTVHWGMLQAIRDSTGLPKLTLLGNSMPLVEDRLVAQPAVQAHQRLRARRQGRSATTSTTKTATGRSATS